MNDVCILQQSYSSGEFHDMMRLTYQRHAAYARAHHCDYWHILGDVHPEMPKEKGGWEKIWWIRRALEANYKLVVWIDTDAAIVDNTVDLRDALPPDKLFGACLHDPEKSEYLRKFDVPAHYNVGVTFWRNNHLAHRFVKEWLKTYPVTIRFLEQAIYNQMVTGEVYAPHFQRLDDKWNATINVNPVPNPVIMGWHGIMPHAVRIAMMRQAFQDDFVKFRI